MVDGEVSLREAIIATNRNAPYGDAPAGDVVDDRIEFADSLLGQTITLNGSALPIAEQLTIFAGGDGVTVDANQESRVFSIASDQDVILRNLTVIHGLDSEGSGIHMTGGGTLRLFESTIANNGRQSLSPELSAFGRGAGVYLDGGTLVSNGSDFLGNHSDEGGAIYSNGDAIRIYGGSFTDNLGQRGGGAITVATGDLLVFESEFVSNSARVIYSFGSGNGGNGGAINVVQRDNPDDGSFTFIVNSTFEKNSSGNGGAISNGANNSLVSHGSIFTSNRAFQQGSRYAPDRGNGGAIQNLGSLRLVDASFTGNNSGYGGAVYSLNETLFNRVDLKENSASHSGGGVSVGGNARFYDTTFGGDHEDDGNSSNAYVIDFTFGRGGALAVLGSENDPGRVLVVGGQFKNNNAGVEGGAIYVSEFANLQIVGGTQIIGNRVYDSFRSFSIGGGVSNYGTTLLADAEIKNNFSDGYAGGIYNGGGDLTMINSVISANHAQLRGGEWKSLAEQRCCFQPRSGAIHWRKEISLVYLEMNQYKDGARGSLCPAPLTREPDFR